MLTEDDLFKEYCNRYWEEAIDRFLSDSANLFDLLCDITKPDSKDDERTKSLKRKYMLIICGIATEAYMNWNDKVDLLDDEIAELEDTAKFKEAIQNILYDMWEMGEYLDDFNQRDYH